MKNILVVDDDRDLCAELKAGLDGYPSLSVVCAQDGLEAMAMIEAGRFDLVITDLHLPEMNGFALVAYLSRHRPHLPVVVITAFGTADVRARLRAGGILSCLDKPVAADVLAEHIFDRLRELDGGGLHGISVAAMLQLLELERKTCTVRVRRETREACLHLLYGRLLDAEENGEHGEAVAREVIGWDDGVAIDIEDQCRSRQQTIDKELRFIIMDSLRVKDEQSNGLEDAALDEQFTAEPLDPESPDPTSGEEDDDATFSALPDEAKDRLRGCLGSLEVVHSYQGSAIMDSAGQILVSHSTDPGLDLALTCRSFCDALRSAERASARLELASCEESVYRTRKGIVLAQTLRRDPSVSSQAHLLVLFGDEISEGMMKIRTRRVVPEVLATLFHGNEQQTTSQDGGQKRQ